jgi:transglutaminase-like putative cysteine protease
MGILLESDDMSSYLDGNDLVQSTHPAVKRLAAELHDEYSTDIAFARAAFEWVRDTIAHSYDVHDSRVTLAASEVLQERVGLCYAKSVLLAALLRSQGIPAGLCYQRIECPDQGFVIHGLVAVWLDGAWHRQDPRGNKPGIDAQFSLGIERLAYRVDEDRDEYDYTRLYTAPAQEIVQALRDAKDILVTPLPSTLSSSR